MAFLRVDRYKEASDMNKRSTVVRRGHEVDHTHSLPLRGIIAELSSFRLSRRPISAAKTLRATRTVVAPYLYGMESEEAEKIFTIFKEFMARVTEFDELVDFGSRLLVGFHQGLEFLRKSPIDKTSELVKNIISANETKRLRSYLVAGCIKTHDGEQNISKCKSMLNQLESLLEDVISTLQTAGRNSPPFLDKIFADRTKEGQTTDDEEEIPSSDSEKVEVTDFGLLMGIIYSMVKQDYKMQERIVSALNLESSSGELETYRLMWSLRPFVNDDIMHQAWKLIP
ncbi:hypothetical protein L484_014741 [Morus notabilis]|uniref:DUF7795 domain-containing protein n=1 Tax=Morus notabilis TaxID=981085 RepID=W9QPH8_9ROSA|nr:hypothetical protein L484_014741 [Morus notabilis]